MSNEKLSLSLEATPGDEDGQPQQREPLHKQPKEKVTPTVEIPKLKVEPTEEQIEKAAELTGPEAQASELGWVPKAQWHGDPEDWVSARQFLRNGELFGRINAYKQKIMGLEKSMEALVKHNEKVYDQGFNDAMSKLKAERRVALKEGDTDRVLEIEEQQEELTKEHQERKAEFEKTVKAPAQVEMHPAWNEWLANNPWYEQDIVLHGYADAEAKAIVTAAAQAGKQIEYEKLLKEVGRKTREKFPEKFGKAPSSSSVNRGDDEPAPKGPRNKQRQLDPMEQEFFKTFEQYGMTKEQYIEQLDALDKKGKR